MTLGPPSGVGSFKVQILTRYYSEGEAWHVSVSQEGYNGTTNEKSLSTTKIPRFVRLGQFIDFVGRARDVVGIGRRDEVSGLRAERGRDG